MDNIQHFFELINSSTRMLIILSSAPSGDVFFSALALQKMLQNYNKELQPKIVCTDLGEFANSALAKEIDNSNKTSKKWEFILDISKNNIRSVRYEKDEHNLKIIITPENSHKDPGEHTFKTTGDFDAAIVLGVKKQDDLDKMLNGNLSKITIINIDNNHNNEKFGTLNIVKESVSVAQIIFQIFKEDVNQKKFGVEELSLLFSAFVSATQQFQDVSTTNSKLLKAASTLLEKGADLKTAFTNIELQTSSNSMNGDEK